MKLIIIISMVCLDYIVNICGATIFGTCAYLIAASRLSLSGDQKVRCSSNSEKCWLVISYLIMMGLFVGLIIKGSPAHNRHICWYPLMIGTTLLTIFISASLISMVSPKYGTVKHIASRVALPAIISVLYLISYYYKGMPDTSSLRLVGANMTHPSIIIWFILLATCLYLLVRSVKVFRSELANYRKISLDYFSEVDEIRFKWIERSFYAAVGICVFALIGTFVNHITCASLIKVGVVLFFMGFAVKYINYTYKFPLLETVSLIAKLDEESNNSNGKVNVAKLLGKLTTGSTFFTTHHITIDDVASSIGVGRTLLSNYLNRELGMNFTTWICSMRIEYAKNLMTEDPSLSIRAVSDRVGFSEPTNFVRKFKQSTNITPLQWKKLRNL